MSTHITNNLHNHILIDISIKYLIIFIISLTNKIWINQINLN